jgi:hypothetical protein
MRLAPLALLLLTARAHAEDPILPPPPPPPADATPDPPPAAPALAHPPPAAPAHPPPAAPAHPPPADPPRPPPKPGTRTHDGFFARFAAGIGYFQAWLWGTSTELGGRIDGRVSASTLTIEEAVGGTPFPGLVIAGTITANPARSPPESRGLTVNGEPVPRVHFDNATLVLLGVLVNYYPDPTKGWMIEATVGFGGMSLGDGTRSNRIGDSLFVDRTPATTFKSMRGVVAGLGGGYEFWAADQFSMGLRLRMSYVRGWDRRMGGESWNATVLSGPDLALTVTYH